MKVVVTGAAGFLGARLADALLSSESPLPVTRLVLADIHAPQPHTDPRVHSLALDLTASAAAESLVDVDCAIVFHLAAVVSGQAESDFDLGLRVNFDATRALLEAVRRRAPGAVFVFASTLGVFGGDLQAVVDDCTATTPQTSYGTAKAACELLVNDYSRRGYTDGRIVRLPTVSVRAGAANAAVTSFASGIVREPLNGLETVCPVPPEQELWLASPSSVVSNLVHAAQVPAGSLGAWRAVNLPGICVAVCDMVAALRAVAGERVATLVRFQRDDTIARMVASFPTKFDNSRALRLGFRADENFEDIIRAYIREDLKRS